MNTVIVNNAPAPISNETQIGINERKYAEYRRKCTGASGSVPTIFYVYQI